MRTVQVLGLTSGLLVSGAVPSAHHTVATVFDTEHVVKLQGRLAEVEWKNPHVVLHLDVTGPDGSLIAWTVETLNIRGLTSKGLTADSYRPGNTVVVTVCTAKDGTHHAVTQSIDRPDGTMYLRMGGC
jgi:hypothetical protein